MAFQKMPSNVLSDQIKRVRKREWTVGVVVANVVVIAATAADACHDNHDTSTVSSEGRKTLPAYNCNITLPSCCCCTEFLPTKTRHYRQQTPLYGTLKFNLPPSKQQNYQSKENTVD